MEGGEKEASDSLVVSPFSSSWQRRRGREFALPSSTVPPVQTGGFGEPASYGGDLGYSGGDQLNLSRNVL